MATLLGSEAVLNAIVTKLQANLPTRIAACNALNTDFALTVPKVEDYYVGKIQQVPKAPAFFVISDAVNYRTDEGTHALSFAMDVCVYILESAQASSSRGGCCARSSAPSSRC